LDADFFCGTERIALPNSTVVSTNPAVWIAAGIRLVVRDLYRRHPEGWRSFRKIEWMYPSVVSNAVIGAKPAHPLVYALLKEMIEMPAGRQLRRYALGTRLLERKIADYEGKDLVIHPPEVFYPLSPEISEHWFRFRKDPNVQMVVSPSTVAVHWYASVRTETLAPIIDPTYVKRNVDKQFFSALAVKFV
jgi:hypothetical protein